MSLRDVFGLPITATFNRNQYQSTAFHSHPEYEIYYFHGGDCHYLIGGRIFTLAPGDLIIMHGMTLHAPKVNGRVPYERTIVHFDPSFAAELIRPPFTLNVLAPFQEIGNARIRLTGPRKAEMESLLAELCAWYAKEDPIAYNRFLAVFLQLLHAVYEGFDEYEGAETSLQDPASAKEQSVQRIVAFLEERYMDDLHLDVLEKELHLNKYYMTRLFKEATGFTIFEYLYERRINQAKLMFLLDPDKPVTEAGYAAGFKHPSHFTRAFKRITGMTPESYKRMMRLSGQSH